ncbi:hypothetical protein CHS0354_015629 [Potamilus streckersoni]|uniref:Ankyrin repeat protein n=1 Tax=Potamilus streckersoni TaxID=2493646 RepID=A0AAE0W8T1_9BIVA|nr:hypothetical protein CHS0354_015629 [Potamilus streckersoni]
MSLESSRICNNVKSSIDFRHIIAQFEDSSNKMAMDFEYELFHAVSNNEPERLKEILEAGADPDQFYEDITRIGSKSILHMACEKGQEKCVKVLVAYNANPRINDRWSQTPLMYCMMTHHYEMGEIILQQEPATVNDEDRYGKTALHKAVETGCEESVRLLLRYNANVNHRTHGGVTAMMFLCDSTDLGNVANVIKLLLDAAAEVDIKDRALRTALHYAAIRKNPTAVELLLRAGADPNVMDKTGRTPLTNIIWENVRIKDGQSMIDPDIMACIELLTQAGSDLNVTVMEYSNPLIVSASLKAWMLVRYFLDHGADPNPKFHSSVTPLLISANKEDTKTAKVLLDWNVNLYAKGHINQGLKDTFRDPVELSLESGCIEFVMLLVGCGYFLNRIEYLRKNMVPGIPQTLQDEPEILLWLQVNARNPHSLFKTVIFQIRSILKKKICRKAEKLPLPRKLIESVQLKDWLG